jgi:hypothetical protein
MPGPAAPIRALHGPGFSAPRLRPGRPPNLLWLDHNEVSSHRFDLAIATWWRTFFDLWKVQADRYAYFVQSIESRFYPLEERVVRAAVNATYDAPLGIITEAPWIRDYFPRLYGRDAGLAVHLRFTPTYSSWLNQVEVWFAKIERDAIARGVFTCVPDLQRKLMRYIARVRAAWHVGRQREWRRNLSAAGLDLGAGFAGEDTAAPVRKFVRADLGTKCARWRRRDLKLRRDQAPGPGVAATALTIGPPRPMRRPQQHATYTVRVTQRRAQPPCELATRAISGTRR